MLRRVTEADVPAVADFAIEGMRAGLYPGVRLSRAKVEAVIRHFAGSASDFNLVAFDDAGRVVGAVAAAVAEMLWFERCEAHVVMCRAVVPGVGRRLLRELRTWVEADMRIRRVLWPMEAGGDPRIPKLAERLGFDQHLALCAFYKE